MNYKLLFPTYRNRYRFIQQKLEKYSAGKPFGEALNLGTGEGDYDAMIACHCRHLTGCDINENDVAFARRLNEGVKNLDYQVENALALTFPANHFDLLVSVEVMEHVGNPEQMTKEIGRVLKPGGLAFITFPQLRFPWTYDPVNALAGKRLIGQGAYAFGHEYLVDADKFKRWAGENGLVIREERNLSGYLVGLAEMYWTGLIQKLFKENAGNVSGKPEKQLKLRPSTDEPAMAKLTDAFIGLDYSLFKNSASAIGKGFVLQKQ